MPYGSCRLLLTSNSILNIFGCQMFKLAPLKPFGFPEIFKWRLYEELA